MLMPVTAVTGRVTAVGGVVRRRLGNERCRSGLWYRIMLVLGCLGALGRSSVMKKKKKMIFLKFVDFEVFTFVVFGSRRITGGC